MRVISVENDVDPTSFCPVARITFEMNIEAIQDGVGRFPEELHRVLGEELCRQVFERLQHQKVSG
jgi:hypothetical protein